MPRKSSGVAEKKTHIHSTRARTRAAKHFFLFFLFAAVLEHGRVKPLKGLFKKSKPCPISISARVDTKLLRQRLAITSVNPRPYRGDGNLLLEPNTTVVSAVLTPHWVGRRTILAAIFRRFDCRLSIKAPLFRHHHRVIKLHQQSSQRLAVSLKRPLDGLPLTERLAANRFVGAPPPPPLRPRRPSAAPRPRRAAAARGLAPLQAPARVPPRSPFPPKMPSRTRK